MRFDHKDVDYNGLTVPAILYKYRHWDDRLHKTSLTNREVYMAAPITFNDDKDCRVTRERFTLSYEDVLNSYYHVSLKENPRYSIEQHQYLAIQLANECNIEELSDGIVNDYVSQDGKLGVLSLAKSRDNLSMWHRYGESGKGFCIGYDTKYLFPLMKSGAAMQYHAQLPKISINDGNIEQVWTQMFNKELHWKVEDEYRTYIYKESGLTLANRLIKVPKECIAELIFGYNISDEHGIKIQNVCKSTGLNPDFYQAKLVNQEITVTAI